MRVCSNPSKSLDLLRLTKVMKSKVRQMELISIIYHEDICEIHWTCTRYFGGGALTVVGIFNSKFHLNDN
jgi:hypothetical protein